MNTGLSDLKKPRDAIRAVFEVTPIEDKSSKRLSNDCRLEKGIIHGAHHVTVKAATKNWRNYRIINFFRSAACSTRCSEPNVRIPR